jgi:hypothetical protein
LGPDGGNDLSSEMAEYAEFMIGRAFVADRHRPSGTRANAQSTMKAVSAATSALPPLSDQRK